MTKLDNSGIERRGKGWQITVPTGRDPITGRYGRIREQFAGTLTDARTRRDELRVNVKRNGASVDGRVHLADYLETWIARRQSTGRIRPQVARTYRGYMRRQVVPLIGSMRLDAVRPVHVQAVLDAATTDGLAPRSVVQVHRILHAGFRSAVLLKAISSNPSDGVQPPKTEAPKLTIPSPADVGRLLDAVDERFRAPTALAAGTGLRRGELLALAWDGVSLDGVNPSIRVTGTLQRDADGSLVTLAPKTERSRRTVPLSASLAVLLKAVRTDQLERRMLAGPAWVDTGYVFDNGTGEPIEPDTFSKAFRSAARSVGLDGVRLHDLRHNFASMLVANGTSIRTVADLMGHATPGFTLTVYAHGSDAAAVTAIGDVERLLGERSR
jgi:integrase